MIQFFTGGTDNAYYFFYNTGLGWVNNQTRYIYFSDIYQLSLLTDNQVVDGSKLLFNLHKNTLTINEAIPNRQLIFECSYSDLPKLPQIHPEFFI